MQYLRRRDFCGIDDDHFLFLFMNMNYFRSEGECDTEWIVPLSFAITVASSCDFEASAIVCRWSIRLSADTESSSHGQCFANYSTFAITNRWPQRSESSTATEETRNTSLCRMWQSSVQWQNTFNSRPNTRKKWEAMLDLRCQRWRYQKAYSHRTWKPEIHQCWFQGNEPDEYLRNQSLFLVVLSVNIATELFQFLPTWKYTRRNIARKRYLDSSSEPITQVFF